ncbi:MAG: FtsX-like permease family protein [Sulfolobales archaeon]
MVGLVRMTCRNLIKRKLRFALTVAGIAVGVALIFSLLSITATAEQTARQQFARLVGYDIAVINGTLRQERVLAQRQTPLLGLGGQSLITEGVADAILSIPEVYAVAPVLTVRGTVNGMAVTVQGVVFQSYADVVGAINVVDGMGFSCYDCREVVVGKGLAIELNASVGSKLEVSIGNTSVEAVVVGIFETGIRFQEMVVYAPLRLVQEASGLKGSITQVLVKCRDPRSVQAVANAITSMFPGLTVVTMAASLQRVEEAINTMTMFFLSIGLVALTAGGFGVMNTMFMAVTERTREIGVLKSIGATDGYIFALFLLESALIGLVGSVTGLFVGVFFTRVVPTLISLTGGVSAFGPRLAQNPGGLRLVEVAITPEVVLTSITIGVLVAVVAGLLPSYRAARMKPAEAVRYV